MKNHFLILFILISTTLFSQEKTKIIEAYVLFNYDTKEVSKLILPNEDLIKALNLYLQDDEWIESQDEKIFNLITLNFNFENLNFDGEKFHNFRFNTGKKKYRKMRFSEPIISKSGNYAIFYEEEKCKKGLCGSGSLILMEKINNNWVKKYILYAWIG